MSNPTHWELASVFKLPGIVTTMHLDPAKVPTRTKRAVQRMLIDGALKGGWNSKSRMLALLLDQQFDLHVIRDVGQHFTVTTQDPALRCAVADQLQADHTAAKVAGQRMHPSWEVRTHGQLQALRGTVRPVSLYFLDVEFATACRSIVREATTDDIRRRRLDAAAMLDGTTLIPIIYTE